jgi:hypothetical protein
MKRLSGTVSIGSPLPDLMGIGKLPELGLLKIARGSLPSSSSKRKESVPNIVCNQNSQGGI